MALSTSALSPIEQSEHNAIVSTGALAEFTLRPLCLESLPALRYLLSIIEETFDILEAQLIDEEQSGALCCCCSCEAH